MILTFDIGTTAVKASLFSRELALLDSETIEYTLITFGTAFVELEVETYWKGVLDCVSRLVARHPEASQEVVAISATTQGETLISVDADGNPLRNAIVWLDGRADAEAETIRQKWSADDFYAKTGIPDCNGLCPVSKLLWLRDNEPEMYQNTHKVLMVEDYILYKLTGRFVTEKSLLSTTGYFDIINDELWLEMFESLDLDIRMIPEVLDCGVVVGKILPQVAKKLKLKDDVRIVTGAMDQVTGAIGAGNTRPGLVSETTGTALTVALTCVDPDMSHPLRLTIYRHAMKGKYLYIPVCMTAGIALKWFKDEFCLDLTAKAEREGSSPYLLIDRLVEAVNPGSDDLILLPNFAGTTQPDDNPAARGVFLGVSLATGRSHFARAIFEGVAFMLRENLELVEQVSGTTVHEIHSLGGGAKSNIWSQIKADVNQKRIITMAEAECASLGTAILVATALGRFSSIEEAASFNRVDAAYDPDEKNRSVYERAYARYKQIYEHTKDLFER
ncbi:MAG TPA: FGGY family carbohydrate kinase [Sphaerochaeta sp.]|jgi:xylulokinase|nr:FGGY family carbohydrate kinase [Sphaerochaeta sp.]HOQ94379.1 FGGY family carbohydrate kinase [Sphaerochaeta sp.]HPK46864.1 FGGY family carbohydrate kinase [Sphaerochaeta sp.]HPY11177.1 FGGY family carbohydrate kinase [Sphaerochaeta sp.]HQB89695.1 FGGY family carbohydrate kinase [Sphaerochaeta sp.]